MKSIEIAAIVFACVFSGAILGTLLHGKLPQHHRDGDSKDVIKLVMGLIATIAALVLGLLIASARSSYDTQESEVRQLAVHLGLLDRILAHYGPEAAPVRVLLKQVVTADIERIWPNEGAGTVTLPTPAVRAQGEVLFGMLASLSPHSDIQRFTQGRAMQILVEMGNTRRLMAEQAGGAMAWPFFVVLVFWLVVLFLGFGLFARFNATVFTAFFIGALSVAGAVFLILEMNHPYSGMMKISSVPMRNVAEQIGK